MMVCRSASSIVENEPPRVFPIPRLPRLAKAFPVSYSNGDRLVGNAVTEDLSWSGCAIAGAASIPVGTALRLRLQFEQGPVAAVPIPLAIVRWAANGRCGVEFIKIDRVDQERLRSLVAGQMPDGLASVQRAGETRVRRRDPARAFEAPA